ncbi:hypothetical protein PAMC26510_05510 [Caballeronia sordidicola]|uniref:Uncharacterized protein n=1 Tax=Caballeronia sordidicola TaxID=196367 RepID=A0A242N7Z4_CABSO|nr:hypothetical protein PAMC26510_05510 [Caballeronia sordidicola]
MSAIKKVVIVTGASQGMGEGIVKVFAPAATALSPRRARFSLQPIRAW